MVSPPVTYAGGPEMVVTRSGAAGPAVAPVDRPWLPAGGRFPNRRRTAVHPRPGPRRACAGVVVRPRSGVSGSRRRAWHGALGAAGHLARLWAFMASSTVRTTHSFAHPLSLPCRRGEVFELEEVGGGPATPVLRAVLRVAWERRGCRRRTATPCVERAEADRDGTTLEDRRRRRRSAASDVRQCSGPIILRHLCVREKPWRRVRSPPSRLAACASGRGSEVTISHVLETAHGPS